MATPPSASTTARPASADTVHVRLQLAEAALAGGQAALAAAICRDILRTTPAHADSLLLQARIALQAGNSAQAGTLLESARSAGAAGTRLLRMLANDFRRSNLADQAIACLDLILARITDDASAWCDRGALLLQCARPDEALASLDRAIALDSGQALSHYNRGNVLLQLQRPMEALSSFDRALACDNRHAPSWCNRGLALRRLDRLQAAIESYDAALAQSADFGLAWRNRGLALLALDDRRAARSNFERAVEIDPNDADAWLDLAMLNLLEGNLPEGLRQYEWRWQTPALRDGAPHAARPRWQGREALQGRTILLHSEQGFGDTLQFCRYAPMLAQQGARVLMQVPLPLTALLRSLKGVAQLLQVGEPTPPFDFHSPLLSLPLALGTTLASIPAPARYLEVEPQRLRRWQGWLGQRSVPRIGLAWRGNPDHGQDTRRSLSPSALLKALDASIVPGQVEFISLQKPLQDRDRAALDAHPQVRHCETEIRDFADTAALCECCDLVISVDTAVAHLAGALGRPVWILLPFIPDWRWLLEREDSPWYPTARLFRQSAPGEWQDVLQKVAQALQHRYPAPTPPAQPATAQRAPALPVLQAQLLHARELARQNQLTLATTLVEAILREDPQHAGAFNLLGSIAAMQGQQERALQMLERAVLLQPQEPGFHAGLAIALHDAGRLDEALARLEQALRLAPLLPTTHRLHGRTLMALERLDEASAAYDRALALQPRFAAALIGRGLIHYKRGAHQLALADFDSALSIEPGNPDALSNRGSALHSLGRTEEALTAFDAALAADPRQADAWYNRGIALNASNRAEEALASYDRALEIRPDSSEAWGNRGNVLINMGDFDSALQSFDRALALRPQFPEALSNKGIALQGLDRLEEAIAHHEQALALKPDFHVAHSNLGLALQARQDLQGALRCFDRALAGDPHLAEARLNKGIALILGGRLAEGWPLYEARWDLPRLRLKKRQFDCPLWLGGPVPRGKTLLLHAEQGFGDTLQFCRYVPLLAAQGVRIVLEVQFPLVPLMQSLKGVAQLVPAGLPLPQFDLHCPLLSLPLATDTTLETIPAAIPYLHADSGRLAAWRQRLGSGQGLLVGLCWRGNSAHRNDRKRSIGLAQLLEALPPTDASLRYVSLHKELPGTDQAMLAKHPGVIHFGTEIGDFADTAALCQLCDLVISVDTSVAHLAGALGRPVWILLPFAPDWRWLLGRGDSPWYPSARLFRQAAPGDWGSALAQLATSLSAYCTRVPTASRLPAGKVLDSATGLATGTTMDATAAAIAPAGQLHLEGRPPLSGTVLAPSTSVAGFTELHRLAVSSFQSGKDADRTRALELFERAARLPEAARDADFLANHALTLHAIGKPAAALDPAREAVRLAPESARCHAVLGAILTKLQDWSAAAQAFGRATELEPDSASHWDHRGTAVAALGALEEAIRCYTRSLACTPSALTYANRGNTWAQMDRLADALADLQRAVQLRPDLGKIWSNQGNVLVESGRIDDALASFDQALALEPGSDSIRANKGMALLLAGRFDEGWPLYEHRPAAIAVAADPPSARPRWSSTGGLRGKTLLLLAEQGFGDVLQFCRYAEVLANMGARILLRTPAALAPLLQTLAGVERLILPGEQLPQHDEYSLLLSIPHVLGTGLQSIPGRSPYLRAPAERMALWSARLGNKLQMRIGLAWRGSPGHVDDRKRSMPLSRLLAALPQGCEYLCLQKDVREEDRHTLAARPDVLDFSDEIGDFADTAALCELCDLVISVDTSVAHLAGALARPVWMLLPYKPDWRWLLGREDSPWYPSARLFRQSSPGDWESALTPLAAALAGHIIGASQSRPPMNAAMAAIALVSQLQREGRTDAAGALLAGMPVTPAADFQQLHQMAVQLFRSHRTDDRARAVELFGQAAQLAAARQNADFQINLALALREADRPAAALESARLAVALAPESARAHSALGAVLMELQDWPAALHAFSHAADLEPGNAVHWNNRALAAFDMGRIPEALADFDRALALAPDSDGTRANKGMAMLLSGRLSEGWPLYEHRPGAVDAGIHSLSVRPRWDNRSSPRGKTLLLLAEQGLGDTLQFCRYVSVLAELGARIILQAQATLAPLLQGLAGLDRLLLPGEPLPEHDAYCLLLSVPGALGTVLPFIPGQSPYLQAPAERVVRWAARLGKKRRMRVGLAWSGSAGHAGDRRRSLPLSRLLDALPAGIEYLSLQKEVRDADRQALQAHADLRHFGDALADFADTAALCHLCDLVISVDTSVAHLAGALGRPVWILLPFRPDWRWLLGRSDSPWYPTARLFRQPAPGDWNGVLGAVGNALEALMPGKSRPKAGRADRLMEAGRRPTRGPLLRYRRR